MSLPTLETFLANGTERPRKNGSSSVQVYVTREYSSVVEKFVHQHKKFFGKHLKIRLLLERISRILIEAKEVKALKGNICERCERIVRDPDSQNVIFIVPARTYSVIEGGVPMRKRVPLKGHNPYGSLCAHLSSSGSDGSVDLHTATVIPTGEMKQCEYFRKRGGNKLL